MEEEEGDKWGDVWAKRSRRLMRMLRYRVPQFEQMGGIRVMGQEGWVRLEQLNNTGAKINRKICNGICRISKG